MFIGANKKKNRRYKEVVYYSNRKPYDLQMRRMDSHGGCIASSVDLLRFMVRVDGQSSKKDILKRHSLHGLCPFKKTFEKKYLLKDPLKDF